MRKTGTLLMVAILVLTAGARLLASLPLLSHSQASAPPQVFRSGVTAVPIDVRVLDRDGKLVTDLRQEEFTIFEEDVRQDIVHMSLHELTPGQPGPPERAGSELPAFSGAVPSRRVFLIVLGAGALGTQPLGPGTAVLPDPSYALDGLLHFVRERLLPQDQVALLAYNRASDFTVDHARVARILEAFRTSPAVGRAALSRDGRETSPDRPPEVVSPGPPTGIGALMDAGLGLAEYMTANLPSAGDISALNGGIKYLRFIGGEKHLVFVTGQGIFRPMPSSFESFLTPPDHNPDALARAASDARVALHIVQTGGIEPDPGPFHQDLPVMTPRILVPGQTYFGMIGSYGGSGSSGRGAAGAGVAGQPEPGWGWAAPAPPVPIPGLNAASMQALGDLRMMARMTGGSVSIMRKASDAVDRIDTATRAEYLLAYYPSNPAADAQYRGVRVEVSRPGVTVVSRRGYFAGRPAAGLTRRTVMADSRLTAAMTSTREQRAIRVTATPAFSKSKIGPGGDVVLGLEIEAGNLGWSTDELSRRVTHLDVAVLCGDASQKVIGQTRRALDVALSEERFLRAATQGIPYTVTIHVTGQPAFVKVAVYSDDADTVGSTVARLPSRR